VATAVAPVTIPHVLLLGVFYIPVIAALDHSAGSATVPGSGSWPFEVQFALWASPTAVYGVHAAWKLLEFRKFMDIVGSARLLTLPERLMATTQAEWE